MARIKKGRPIHGWLVIDKPLGLTSSQVVGIVKRELDAQKVGHAGTLDPLATGVLPIAVGEATKTVSFVMDGAKAYRFTVKWGSATNTDDAEGEIIETSSVRPTGPEIEAALKGFIGEIQQVPPVYSAIKIDGKRAYKMARAGEAVEMKARTAIIDDFRLLDVMDGDSAKFEVFCQKGTYVRALGRDLAVALGTVGHIVELRRIKSGPFGENDTISLDLEGGLRHSARLETGLTPIETALDDIPALALTEEEAGLMHQGGFVNLAKVLERSPNHKVVDGEIVLATAKNGPVALARIVAHELRPVRVFNI
ncbi:MAG: tRNA pseudouridine(55) synthase TruB [Rhodospirillaceae bacterium]|nr:tRNA pseudouridine(55) synthase TruB [Rhodospirillaceae bacterium]